MLIIDKAGHFAVVIVRTKLKIIVIKKRSEEAYVPGWYAYNPETTRLVYSSLYGIH